MSPRAAAVSLAVGLTLVLGRAAGALAADPAAIARETVRYERRPGGVVQVWWLPTEYWEQTARDTGWTDEQVTDLRERIQSYLVLAVLDVKAGTGGVAFVEHPQIAEQLRVQRGQTELPVLRRFDPRLTALVPELAHPLRVSLGPLGPGVRLLFFANVDEQGRPVLNGATRGELRASYRAAGAVEPIELRWLAPLTSVVGSVPCPKGGEPLEASWSYCPWHGVPVAPREAARPAAGGAGRR